MMEAEHVTRIGKGNWLYAAALHGESERQTAGVFTKGDGTTQVWSAANAPLPKQLHCVMLVMPLEEVLDHCGQFTHTVTVWFAVNTPDMAALYLPRGHGGR